MFPVPSDSVWSTKPGDILANQLLNIAAQTQTHLSNFNLSPFVSSFFNIFLILFTLDDFKSGGVGSNP